MLVKVKCLVTREPVCNKFVEEDIDINCYSPEDRIYLSIQVSPSVMCDKVVEGDTIICMGNMKINKSKEGKTYFNIKAKEIKCLGQLDLSF